MKDDLIRGDLVSDDATSPPSWSASTRTASTRSVAASSQRIHDLVDPELPPGVKRHYNGSLEISETYNRITLDNQRNFTPPILLFTIAGST